MFENSILENNFPLPEAVKRVDINDLTAHERCLLANDGLATVLMEAIICEPMRIIVVHQGETNPPADHLPFLGVDKNATVLERQVEISGGKTNNIVCNATSWFYINNLPDQFARAIHEQTLGIGEVLSTLKAETRRKLLWFGQSKQSPDIFCRGYKISMNDKPVVYITEYFHKAALSTFHESMA